ncbi:hypothetical protein [Streptomyces litchfieldiae]|uniref:Lipoprotein n=1 Tax=Streptomyces litchfieldiae TaxID=3075543 RepID=A0ABU2MU57_9ACTN|nr:hypothetical protein [Streptomyces sp. DSM 44938]MDT0345171.1 hypothetical protein [Streptomyces sp. DSM 44938]
MFASRRRAFRRTAAHSLAGLALATAVLTGCTSEDDGQADAPTSPPAETETEAEAEAEADASTDPADDSADSADASGDPADETASADAASWAGTKQFMQIRTAWTSDGQTFLEVRGAEKVAVTSPHEAWQIIPGEGPYTTVTLAADAQVLLAVPMGDESAASSYSQAEFVSRLTEQPEVNSRIGYDISFDGEGRVSRLESLYTP